MAKTIQQTWRSVRWTEKDAEHDFNDVSEGWEKHYWAPWRKSLGQP